MNTSDVINKMELIDVAQSMSLIVQNLTQNQEEAQDLLFILTAVNRLIGDNKELKFFANYLKCYSLIESFANSIRECDNLHQVQLLLLDLKVGDHNLFQEEIKKPKESIFLYVLVSLEIIVTGDYSCICDGDGIKYEDSDGFIREAKWVFANDLAGAKLTICDTIGVFDTRELAEDYAKQQLDENMFQIIKTDFYTR